LGDEKAQHLDERQVKVPPDTTAPQSSESRDRASEHIAQYVERRHSTASGEIRQHSTSSKRQEKAPQETFDLGNTHKKKPSRVFFLSIRVCKIETHTRARDGGKKSAPSYCL